MTEKNTKLLDWDSLIQDYRSSGQTGAAWCDLHGLKISQLRWQITKRQRLNQQNSDIQWVSLEGSISIKSLTVKIGPAEIVVSEGFNKELFTEIVQSLMSIC